MLKKLLIVGFVTAAAPVFAGDVGAGQEVFEKQCKNCCFQMAKWIFIIFVVLPNVTRVLGEFLSN